MNNLPADVVKFLKENAPPPLVSVDDLTSQVAAKEWGVSETTAQIRLDNLVLEKKLKTEQRRSPNGRIITIYVPKKG